MPHVRQFLRRPGPAGAAADRARAGIPGPAGAGGERWSGDLRWAVGNCSVFVALLSDRYLHGSTWCAMEWDLFSRREMRARSGPRAEAESAILPILWTPVTSVPEPGPCAGCGCTAGSIAPCCAGWPIGSSRSSRCTRSSRRTRPAWWFRARPTAPSWWPWPRRPAAVRPGLRGPPRSCNSTPRLYAASAETSVAAALATVYASIAVAGSAQLSSTPRLNAALARAAGLVLSIADRYAVRAPSGSRTPPATRPG